MSELHWCQIHWPSPLPEAQALEVLRRFAAEPHPQPFVLETRATAGSITHRVGAPASMLSSLTHLLGALAPGTVLEETSEESVSWMRALRLRLPHLMLGLHPDRLVESSRALLAALTHATDIDDHLLLQVTVAGSQPSRLVSKPLDPRQGLVSQLLGGTRPAPPEAASAIRARAAERQLVVKIRVAASAPSRPRADHLLRGVTAALRLRERSGVGLSFHPVQPWRLSQLPKRSFASLTPAETLGLLGWPLGTEPLPGLPGPHPKQLRLRLPPNNERVFGRTTAPGQDLPLGIPISDALFHTVITGPTGAGKSTLLTRLITADMEAGRAVVVIDPKSDLVTDSLARVPEHRRGDVVILDPIQVRPVGLNPLRQPGRSPELIADGLLTVFRDLFPSMFGPRTSDVLHSALLTLTTAPEATLTWLPRLLSDTAFRRPLVARIQDEALLSFWGWFDALSPSGQAQAVGPVLSRLRQFLLRPTLRRVLDQAEPRFQLSDLFRGDRQPLLFVPLNTGILGTDTARLLGSLLVTQLWGLLLGRTTVPKSQRLPVSIYIDEAQEFLRLGGELSDALARSRSLGAAWHLAHQYREQFTPEVRSAIDNNARNKIAFTLGARDARDMGALAPELTPEDFLALPRFHVYANTLRGGQHTGWVSGRTLPPPPETSDPLELTRLSQASYGSRQDTLEQRIEPTVTSTSEPLLGRKPRR